MQHRPVITLTTDFGYQDPFVGVMKGVILKVNPEAEIVDLSHGIKAHDIREAAFTIGMNFKYFPEGTIHLVVVDPGVGSARRPIMVMNNRYQFIGPDNGVFSQVYTKSTDILEVVHITSEHYFLKAKSPTFQGRDLFAPVAGWLSKGVGMSSFGELIDDYHRIDLPLPSLSGGILRGEVIHIDRFGNAITNITSSDIEKLLPDLNEPFFVVRLKGLEIPFRSFYAEAGDGGLHVLMNSSGHLEFFTFEGDASASFAVPIGEKVEILPLNQPS